MTNPDSISKSRDTTLPTKVWIVKAVVFPVVMYGCQCWTISKLSDKNWCFWTVLEKTLESPLDFKEIKPGLIWCWFDAEAETPIPPDGKGQLTGKDPDAEKDGKQKEKGWQRMGWLDSITNLMDMSLSKLQEIVKGRGAWCATVHRIAKSPLL